MILYTFVSLWLRGLVCRVRGHRWEGRLQQTCPRCASTRRFQYTRHQGQRERARRIVRIIRGVTPLDEIYGGSATRWQLQAWFQRERASGRFR